MSFSVVFLVYSLYFLFTTVYIQAEFPMPTTPVTPLHL